MIRVRVQDRSAVSSMETKIDVRRVENGRIAAITTFDATLVPAFGLPEVLS